MESAIPHHLLSHRTQSARMKPDWQPPYPSFVARFAPSVVPEDPGLVKAVQSVLG